jgi:redox-sensitive bicupin YhaK (pirin superfamily)
MSILSPRDVPLGGLRAMTVRRTLPGRGRTTIGAWCFVDHFGPDLVERSGGMLVAPHPHTGLQTVSWLFQGEVEHRDSVGSHQLINPGEVNLMTAGRGISHSEVSTPGNDWLHGVQLWVALPDAHRHIAPFFEHHEAEKVQLGAAEALVFVGSLGGKTAGTTTFTPLVGAEVNAPAHTTFTIPVRADFEHGVLVDTGFISLNGEDVAKDALGFVSAGITELSITTGDWPVRLVLLGGTPFEEELVMWWNFIGRSHDEIVAFREQWQRDVVAGANPSGVFGQVDYPGGVIPAPKMPHVMLRPRKTVY